MPSNVPMHTLVSIRARTTDELGELKAQFLASLNHEMRTPLTGILGMLDLLLETNLDAEQREFALNSHLCARELLELMNSTLEFSALAANQVVLEEADFQLWETLDTLTGEFSPQAAAKGLIFIGNFDPDLPEVVIGDELRIKQLLSYLIANAIKFTNQGEVELSVSVQPSGEAGWIVAFSVRDTGIGVPPDQIESIFESFRQSETGLSRRYAGMGLGLALSQKLAKLMHSEVKVVSELGTGSTFSVNLPLRAPRDIQRRPAQSTPDRFKTLRVDEIEIAHLRAIAV
jgi:two-component system sensor histidine kinase/response regulator